MQGGELRYDIGKGGRPTARLGEAMREAMTSVWLSEVQHFLGHTGKSNLDRNHVDM